MYYRGFEKGIFLLLQYPICKWQFHPGSKACVLSAECIEKHWANSVEEIDTTEGPPKKM